MSKCNVPGCDNNTDMFLCAYCESDCSKSGYTLMRWYYEKKKEYETKIKAQQEAAKPKCEIIGCGYESDTAINITGVANLCHTHRDQFIDSDIGSSVDYRDRKNAEIKAQQAPIITRLNNLTPFTEEQMKIAGEAVKAQLDKPKGVTLKVNVDFDAGTFTVGPPKKPEAVTIPQSVKETFEATPLTLAIELPKGATMTPHTKDECPWCVDQREIGRKTCYSHKEDGTCRISNCYNETQSKFSDYCKKHQEAFNKSECNDWDEFCLENKLHEESFCAECQEVEDLYHIKTCPDCAANNMEAGDVLCDVLLCQNTTTGDDCFCKDCGDVFFSTKCEYSEVYEFTKAVYEGKIPLLYHLSKQARSVTIKEPTTQESIMSKILDIAKDDTKEAALRLAGKQFKKLTSDTLAAAIARTIDPNDESLRAKMSAFFKTELGQAMLAGISGVGLEMIPRNDFAKDLAKELRVSAMADAGDVVADLFMAPLRQVISSFVQGEVPAALEAVSQSVTKVEVSLEQPEVAKVGR